MVSIRVFADAYHGISSYYYYYSPVVLEWIAPVNCIRPRKFNLKKVYFYSLLFVIVLLSYLLFWLHTFGGKMVEAYCEKYVIAYR